MERVSCKEKCSKHLFIVSRIKPDNHYYKLPKIIFVQDVSIYYKPEILLLSLHIVSNKQQQ